MDLGLKGQWVLIPGGSQGIGPATARAFAAESCNLHLAARLRQRPRDILLACWREVRREKKDDKKHGQGALLNQVAISPKRF